MRGQQNSFIGRLETSKKIERTTFMGVGLFNQGFFMNHSTGRVERRDGRSARQRRRSTLAHGGVTGEARIILRQRSAPTGHLVTYLIRGYLRATKISTLKISNKIHDCRKKKVNK